MVFGVSQRVVGGAGWPQDYEERLQKPKMLKTPNSQPEDSQASVVPIVAAIVSGVASARTANRSSMARAWESSRRTLHDCWVAVKELDFNYHSRDT